MDFVAIDFETANSKRDSACSVGVSVVRNNIVEANHYWLIKPVPLDFHPFNVSIHGITKSDVLNSPNFSEVWSEIAKLSGDLPFVAHNASFDMSVVRNSLSARSSIFPTCTYFCTLVLAKVVYPNLGSYRLNHLCKMLNINLTHHDASSDAKACADLFLSLCKSLKISDMLDLNQYLNFGKIYNDNYGEGYSPCGLSGNTNQPKKSNIISKDLSITSYNELFHAKNFVFTGTLMSMPRVVAKEIVIRSGGNVQNSITSSTNYLVTGMQDPFRIKDGLSSKQRKALDMAEKGKDIQIIEEDAFVEMINDDAFKAVLDNK